MDDVNTAPENTTEKPEGSELTINDLAAVRSIIDVASQRGAFKPAEMVAVGTVYSKIDAFLNAIAEKTPPNA
jgi:hypothetical protein